MLSIANCPVSYDGSALPAPWGSGGTSYGSVTNAYAGTTTTVTDQANRARQTNVDGLRRLASVVEDPFGSLNATTTYAYDALDDLTSVTAGTQSRGFGYDSLKRLSYSYNPESGAINYHYDAAGNVIWRDDYAGQQTCYTYDALNRVTGKTYYQGSVPAAASGNCSAITAANLLPTPAVSYTYDQSAYGKGLLTSVTASGVSATAYNGYDPLGRVTSCAQTTAGQTYKFAYQYNLADSLVAETLPSGRLVATTFDGANRASQVAAAGKNYLSSIAYAPHGGLQSFAYGNGFSRKYAYDPRRVSSWVLDLRLFWGANSTQTASNNGNLQSQLIQTCNGTGFATAANFTQTYAYDNLNRVQILTDSGGGANQRNFSYDRYGNMWENNASGAFPLNSNSPASNVYSASNNRRTDAGFAYDANGSLTSIPNSVCASANCIQYDAEHRQTSFAASGTTYQYDGDGHRVTSITGGVTTVFVYDALGGLAAKYSSNAASVHGFVKRAGHKGHPSTRPCRRTPSRTSASRRDAQRVHRLP